MKLLKLIASMALTIVAASAHAVPFVFSDSGATAGSIQNTVDAFRSSLGTLNANVAGSFGSGRREINWDGVPDLLSAPNNLPGNFFNSTSPRGVEFTTPGTGFQVSARAGVAPVEFGNIDLNYPALFAPFSAERLFTALGSNVIDISFFIPGSATAALSTGFGAIFSDVDQADTTSIEFFNELNQSLGQFYAPSILGSETLSFLGVTFTEGNVISRARITNGNQVLAPGFLMSDQVVMDDFIFGEPVAATVPEPATLLLLLAGVATIGFRRRFDNKNLSRGWASPCCSGYRQ